jgi:hypothetical protein
VIDVLQYPPAVGELLLPERVQPLDAGKPNEGVRPKLAALGRRDVVGQTPADPLMASACLAGLWLYHDFLDESHTLSQEIETPTGSFWHAIMHRREGDYDNSKYWWRRVGVHPVFDPLREQAREALHLTPAGPNDSTRDMPPKEIVVLLHAPKWDPLRLVDLCETACKGRNDLAKACRTLQQCEWRVLYDFCFRAARGET